MTAYVLMTAMPPTTGHLELIQYASVLDYVQVVLCTQPHEPYPSERAEAISDATMELVPFYDVRVHHIRRELPQDPETPGFWEIWRGILAGLNVGSGDLIVASEPYGMKLAEITGAQFMPYDIDRSINPVKAEAVRRDPLTRFGDILPDFQRHLTTTVTVFGAESTGKTTLAQRIARRGYKPRSGWFIPEWARPYLENTSPDINTESMTAIWRGQNALQWHARRNLHGRPVIVQDTDLFSTIGYWRLPHWEPTLGPPPGGLVRAAKDSKSDLYIVTRSNIPFEEDPLRYGGDKRESDDQYWIDLLDEYELPCLVLDTPDLAERIKQSRDAVDAIVDEKLGALRYDRQGL